jgi:hypothetical protein
MAEMALDDLQIHDFNAPEVQGYIHNEIAPMFNGDPNHAFAHPEFYGPDKSCSHFPVSNIVAQGRNVGEYRERRRELRATEIPCDRTSHILLHLSSWYL